ncbi:MFS transporter [Paenibacillus montanisoli]|uniref:MFS transporter n=2 Tax=Paenibacillus montanisoli TaxID=2081970 RepID=A0A328TUW2_9BACL|nr:MFS transporter [Paenibacillus montanisoli]
MDTPVPNSPSSGSKTSLGSMLKNRFIQAILSAGVFMQIGIWVRNFAVLLFVVEMTDGDAFAVSLVSVAEFAPIFVFSFIGGAFADRWRPKRTMVLCDLLSAISIFVILLTLIYGSWQAVFFATFVSAILSQFSQPSSMKLFKLHVPGEQMQAGMALFQTMMAVFMILGPILGTFVFEQLGIYWSMGIVCVAFLVSAAVLTLLPADRVEEKENAGTSIWTEMKMGIDYVLHRKALVALGGSFLAAGLGIGIIHTLAVFLITEQLGLPKGNLQWLFAANGAAMLVGGGLSMAFSNKAAPQTLVLWGMLVTGIGVSVMGFSEVFWLTLAMEAMIGLFMPALQIGINTLILNKTEEAFVGRVNGILTPMFMGAMVVTMSIAGLLKASLSLSWTYQFSAAMFLIGIVFLLPLYRIKDPVAAKAN